MFAIISSFLTLFVCMYVGYEISYRLGKRKFSEAEERRTRDVVDNLQSATIGLFALLIGFTFSMSLDRFNQRREIILQESNAIGTVYLRADFLAADEGAELRNILKKYVKNRIDLYSAGADRNVNLALVKQMAKLHSEIWSLVASSTLAEKNSELHALIVSSVNELIDLAGARTSAMLAQIPGGVILLLCFFSVAVAAILGYRQAFAGSRAWVSSMIYIFLILAVIYVILDLSRPKTGLIRSGQSAMLLLDNSLNNRPLEAGILIEDR